MGASDDSDRTWKHYVCGSAASVINILVTFPIQKVMFRQQLHGFSATQSLLQLKGEGRHLLYRGVLPPLMQRITTIGLMFGLYEEFSRPMLKYTQDTQIPEQLTRSAAAFMAGTSEAVMVPFERVQTLLQDHKHHARFKSTSHAFKTLLRDYGVKECYRGLTPVLFRNGPCSMLYFGLRGPLKELLPEAQTQQGHLLNDFVSGALIGGGISTLFYPMNVVKSRAQSQVGGEFVGFPRLLHTVLKERNWSLFHLYRGGGLNVLRSVTSWGIITATYEFLMKSWVQSSKEPKK
uniref:Solute carrier family 25 member 51-like n=1 Tax=Astyanax mexicanus TaxID=7994 RepID=A0A3B1KEQ9_ASTMX